MPPWAISGEFHECGPWMSATPISLKRFTWRTCVWCAPFVLFLFGILLWFFGADVEDLRAAKEWDGRHYWISGGFLVGLFAIGIQVRATARDGDLCKQIDELKSELERERNGSASVREELDGFLMRDGVELLQNLTKNIFAELNFADTRSVRVSLYVPKKRTPSKKKTSESLAGFQRVGRYTEQPEWRGGGNPLYPYTGILKLVWRDGCYVDQGWPCVDQDPTGYYAKHAAVGVLQADAEKMRMKSRSYAGIVVGTKDDPEGLLLVESINKKIVPTLDNAKLKQRLAALNTQPIVLTLVPFNGTYPTWRTRGRTASDGASGHRRLLLPELPQPGRTRVVQVDQDGVLGGLEVCCRQP